MTQTWETTRTRHGTNSGWAFHQRLGERPCDACYAANAAYNKRRRSAPEEQRRSRLAAKAQGLANVEMRRLYPNIYARLYQQFKKEVGL